MQTMNARGVFDSIRIGDDDDDQATMLYKAPRRAHGARQGSNFPPPVRVVAAHTAPRANRSEMPPPARRSAPPPAMRAPAITLESVPVRAPRPSLVAATESTPAMAFDADSGEHRTPTVPVPRPVEQRSKLPYLAAGVLALAAGALVVLLAGLGKRSSSYPEAWAAGAAASSAQTHAAAAPAPVAAPVAVAQPAAQPSSASDDRIYAAAFAASYAAAASEAPRARVARAPQQRVAVAPAPAPRQPLVKAETAKPTEVAKPGKPAKAEKPSKAVDEETNVARKVGADAADELSHSL